MDERSISRVGWIDGHPARRERARPWVEATCLVVECEPEARLEEFDLFVLDDGHPRVDTGAFVAALRERGLDAPVVVIVGDDSGVGPALRAGAYDVLRDPLERESCEAALRRARERQALVRRVRALQAAQGPEVVPLHELERLAIEKALAATRGSVEKAARLLGMGRATLYRRLATIGPSKPSSP
jgi:DNA-binding NtrC family response regulator